MLFFYVKLNRVSVTTLESAPWAIDGVGHFGELFFEVASGEAAA